MENFQLNKFLTHSGQTVLVLTRINENATECHEFKSGETGKTANLSNLLEFIERIPRARRSANKTGREK